jgi:type III pantothenate kinase
MRLLIDVGNSRVKWQYVVDDYHNELQTHYGLLSDLAAFIETLEPKEIDVSLAAVNQTEQLENLLSEGAFKSIKNAQSESFRLGLNNSYANPERMGVDRWLAMIAAYSHIKNETKFKGFIVVDAGSALTIDVVDEKGQHQGGYIVPGLLMAQKALFANTEQVIQYNESVAETASNNDYHKLGNNTLQCVEYGVVNQMVALVKFLIEEYPDYEVFFTGGDGAMLADHLKTGTVDKDLVLKGLWQVSN